MSEWQPIETAPNDDGDEAELWAEWPGDPLHTGQRWPTCERIDGEWYCDGMDGGGMFPMRNWRVTHWRPIPEPPK